jgi:hypothetical protein
MKKTNILTILILSLGLMLTACGSKTEDNGYSIDVPPPLTPSSNQKDVGPLFVEECFDGIDNDGNGLIDEDCNSNFVAVGNDGIIIHSDNGTDWNVDESKLGTGKNLMDIASGAGNWVAVGSDGSDGFVIKYDIATGLQTTDLSSHDIDSLNGIAYGTTLDGKGKWVAVGTKVSGSIGIIATSDDGIVWTPIISKAAERYKDVVYGDGKWIAVGLNSTGGIVRSSDDWDGVVKNTNGIPLYDVAYDGIDTWVAIGAKTLSPYDTVIIEFDSDLNILPEVSIGNIELDGIASDGKGNLVAVGDDQGHGIAVTSDNWFTTYDAAPGKALKSVVYGNEEWIAVGMSGTIVTSPTSTPPVISPVTSDTTKSLNAIVFKP